MKRRYGSIQLFILIPVLILGAFTIISNLVSVKNIKNVNSSGSEIADNYLVSISRLGDMQLTSQTLHELALSHIVATDFSTMVSIVDEIREQQAKLDKQLSEFKQFVNDANNKEYDTLCKNIESFDYYLADIMAFSAAGDKINAYACANGEIALYGGEIKECISRITDKTTSQAEAARQSLSDVYENSISTSNLIIMISIIILAAVFAIVIFVVIRPLASVKKQIASIINSIDRREGDLTKRIKVRSSGEVAALRDGINLFMDKLQAIFKVICENSNKMNMVVSEVRESVSTSNKSATDMSAIAEEISSTMCEMSDNVSHVNKNTTNVENDMNIIAEKTYEINRYSKQMKDHADQIENTARTNMNQTSEKVSNIMEELKRSIEESRSIEQIDKLTNDILDISRHTNILAINATIEASKAGEAGKSFAVVATEVGKLAKSTRESANTIQNVSEVVTNAVGKLVSNADELITFMSRDILPGFEMFVKSGEQYKENAAYIENTMDEFSEKIEKLKQNMTMISQSMNNIANSIRESTTGINTTAENTQILVQDIDRISSRMDDNMRIVTRMNQETEIFTNW